MSFESPISVLYNSEGNEIALSQSQVISASAQPGLVVVGSGSDGRAYFMKMSTEGAVFITGSLNTSITFPATQSVEIGRWNNNVTASVKVDAWTASVTASVRDIGGGTTTVSSVDTSTTNYNVLGVNTNRLAATFFKEGGNICYLKLGATASSTSYTVRLTNNAYFEVPEKYTGQIDVIFSTNAAGNTIRLTEISYP